MHIVLLFPGQSSRYPGMLRKLSEVRPDVVDPLFRHAEDVLGQRVTVYDACESTSARNLDIQLSVFLANHAYGEILRAEGIEGDASVGLSLGEYNHLVHIGVLGFEDALRLVAARGAAYDQGPAGAMAAVFPVDESTVHGAVARAAGRGVVEVATFNSPTQFVLAGERVAIDEAVRILEDEQAATAVFVDERLPMHSSLFSAVAARFRPSLEAAPVRVPLRPYVPNVLGRIADTPTPQVIRRLLLDQVQKPVRFRQSVDAIADRFSDAVYVEVGPRSVLYNLLSKKWRPFRRYKTDAEADRFAIATSELVHELRRAA
jgi:[acyl-carrier-protein] S-malonyltransferase